MLYYLSLGGNIGDTAHIFDCALQDIDAQCGEVIAVSSYIRTAPWGFSAENDFTNSACIVRSDTPPMKMLDDLMAIEKKYGRERPEGVQGYSSRTLDIDIIFIDDMVIDSDRLQIPHPLCTEREFVLRPLCEIAPEYIHPVCRESISSLLQGLEGK